MMDYDNKIVGRQIKYYREKHNLSLVCDALDITLQDFFTEPQREISDLDILKYINELTQEQKVKLYEFLKTIKRDYDEKKRLH